MEDIDRIQINALLSGRREISEEDLELGRQVHARAKKILEPLPATHDTQILWGSDDDRAVQIKRKRIIYESENGTQELALTDFHKNDTSSGIIAVELPDKKGHYSDDPDYIFAVHPDGTMVSPLGLVIPELANTMLELFEEVPKVSSVKTV